MIGNLSDLHVDGPIPSAVWFQVMRCDSETHVHIVLFDGDDVPFAQMTVDRGNVETIIRDTAHLPSADNIVRLVRNNKDKPPG